MELTRLYKIFYGYHGLLLLMFLGSQTSDMVDVVCGLSIITADLKTVNYIILWFADFFLYTERS